MNADFRGYDQQRGVTLFGLMLWAIVFGFGALVGMKVLPTLNEYFTIKKAVNKIANEGAPTVSESIESLPCFESLGNLCG